MHYRVYTFGLTLKLVDGTLQYGTRARVLMGSQNLITDEGDFICALPRQRVWMGEEWQKRFYDLHGTRQLAMSEQIVSSFAACDTCLLHTAQFVP